MLTTLSEKKCLGEFILVDASKRLIFSFSSRIAKREDEEAFEEERRHEEEKRKRKKERERQSR